MDEQQTAFGSGDLTPELVRGARFATSDQGYDPAQVNEFLEQIASALGVLTANDATGVMRAELQRNSEISTRLLMAGQEAADMLRRQAADEARGVIEETRQLAEQLRESARDETARTQRQMEELRRAFIEELRDMYDHIGASLYRFENVSRTAEAGERSPTFIPDSASQAASPVAQPQHGQVEAPPEAPPAQAEAPSTQAHRSSAQAEAPAAQTQPEQQFATLPADDDSLDEGEPLVDLRGMHQIDSDMPPPITPPAAAADESGLAYQDPGDPNAGDPSAGDSSWLMAPPEPAQAAGPVSRSEAQPPPSDQDDLRAEALIAGFEGVLENLAPGPPPLSAPPPPLPDPPGLGRTGGQPVDEEAVRQFVLQSVHDGSPRDAIENYLRETLGIEDAPGIVDRVLGEAAN